MLDFPILHTSPLYLIEMTISLIRYPIFEEYDNLFDRYNAKVKKIISEKSSLTFHEDSTDSASIIKVEVPGVDPAEVKVKIEGSSLSVDTPAGSLYRSIGQRLDVDSATANLKRGMLTITIPKKEAKVVEVKVHEG